MEKTEALKKARGLRIRELRNLLYMSRRAFADKHQIPYPTMQNWEDGRFGGLSKKGAKLLSEIFQSEGINCNSEWLLDEMGVKPQHISRISIHGTHNISKDIDPISAELQLFYQHNPNATHTIINDNLMQPRFSQNEYVAGVQCNMTETDKFHMQDCVIHTKQGNIIVNRVEQSNDPYTLEIYPLSNPTQKAVIAKSDVVYLAPIVWARRS